MTTKRICYIRPDGGLSVVVPNPAARRQGESEDDFIARIRAKDVPDDAVEVEVIEQADLPSNRERRNDWALAMVGGRRRVVERDR